MAEFSFLDATASREYALRIDKARRPLEKEHEKRRSELVAKVHANNMQNSGLFIEALFMEDFDHAKAIVQSELSEIFSMLEELHIQLADRQVAALQETLAKELGTGGESAIQEALKGHSFLDAPTAADMTAYFRPQVEQAVQECSGDVELRVMALRRMQTDSHKNVAAAENSNPYIELRAKFMEGHARHGGGGFQLGVLTDEQVKEIETVHGLPRTLWLGGFSAGAADSYSVYGEQGREEAFGWFRHIASQAGAYLPLAIRRQFMRHVDDPASEWLAFMYHWAPPQQATRPFLGRKVWIEPFRSAADAIERGGLLSAPTSPAAEERKSLTAREAANLYAKLTHTKSDPRRARRELRNSDGTYTETSVCKRVLQVFSRKKTPAKTGRFICSQCKSQMDQKFPRGPEILCRDCFIKRVVPEADGDDS